MYNVVICKLYRQGNCRYGQYCQFEHVNHFGGPITDLSNEDEIAVIVAKEVLLAEKGGQWLLSCFAPLKGCPSIPDMEDLSPDEVRWEMYQAQKSGMFEQANLHFQQLCQDMKAKRDALKNPSRETITMLKKLLGSSQIGGLNENSNTTKKSSHSFLAASQLNNMFGKQTFGVHSNSSFSGGFNFSNNTTIFGRSNNSTTPMFGGTPTFGNNNSFGTTTNTSSIFSGTTNTPTFGTVASQSNPIFGSTSQGIFGQSNVFGGGTSELTTSAFDSGATSSLFNNPMTFQANISLFAAAQTTTASLFGGSSNTQTNSVFGATTSSGPFNAGLFSQPKTLPAIDGAPVFGGATNYTGNSSSIFGGSAQTFGTPAISSSGIFGAAATTTPAFGGFAATITPAFGTSAATTTPAFGGTAVTTTPAFSLGQQPVANTFGTPVSTPNVFGAQNTGTAMPISNNTPFGEPVNGPFVTVANPQFGSTSTTSTPFASAGFGLAAANTSDTFGTAATSSNSLFANAICISIRCKIVKMVICKFYRQGNCRYGQYCQFEHVNHFGGPKTDLYNEDEIAVIVAKEVLLAERGGQWLLSCFAPLKERPSIPGMEDLSPDEVRWEMYQAQKSGMVEQAKLHFQQLCQDMKAKRDALKNPSRETITMLKKLLGSGQKGGLSENSNTTKKSSHSFLAASQLNLANSTPANNVFGKQTFGVQSNSSFSGGFNSSNNTSIFGRSNNNTTPMFGSTPTFGNNISFGTTTNTSSIFSGTTNTPTFGTVASQSNPIFGSTSQGIFGQSNVFGGGTSQLNSQSTTSAFDSGATSATSLFNNPMTAQANTSLFSAAQTTTASLFGGSSNTQTNPVFGATTSSGPFNAGLFSQPKTLPAFGGAPVFGGATNYTGNSSSIFGGSAQTFGTPAISSSGIFGAAATTTPAFGGSAATITPAFGTSVATTTPAFGGTAVTTTPAFSLGQQPVANTFGTPVSTPNVFGAQNTGTAMPISNNTPFGELVNGPFVTVANSQFGSTSTTSTPFASAGFGLAAANTSDTFGTAATSSNSLFANAGTTFASSSANVVSNVSPFPPIFGAQPFGGINTTMATTTTATVTTTTTVTNPFAPRTQQSSTPFGSVAQNQLTTSSASPFGNTSLAVTITSTIIDDSVYTAEDALTNDEISMYLADKFVVGKIPLKPPTKNIR
ncbi:nuclear pore complex protein DDB_G0274915-like [Odontomachus brunneus]|uniref:nuclear pore complex protein DDB_G0274915-like n=1 Tax=Odontomachus brunneus TaxID=486640 RepID=UPI0013F1994F|nr:nuclear pore complex protein DDB_G0274915-like [Odontomachus brunneus]